MESKTHSKAIFSMSERYDNPLKIKLKKCIFESLNKRINSYNSSSIDIVSKLLMSIVSPASILSIKENKYNRISIKTLFNICDKNDIEIKIVFLNTITPKLNSLDINEYDNTYNKIYSKILIEFENIIKIKFPNSTYLEIGNKLGLGENIYRINNKPRKLDAYFHFLKILNDKFDMIVYIKDNKALGYDPFVVSD